MKSHLTKHVQDLYNLSIKYNDLKSLLYLNIGIVFGNTLINIAQKSLSKRLYLSFKTKSQKIVNLIKCKRKPCNTNYFVPIINLSNYNLSNQEKQQLKLGLDYCFFDKNIDVRAFLAANMEYLADNVKGNIYHKSLKYFHEFLRGYTDIFANNIYATKDPNCHNLRGMIQNNDIVVVQGDKDSSVVIMKKSDYVTKLDTMIDGGIMKGTNIETNDEMLKELSQFQDFLYTNFHKYERYMQPDSNQPAHLYGTAKTHKFETLENITLANMRFRPIIDQIGMFTYNAAKVISDYLRSLCKNEYSINDTQRFSSMLSLIPLLQNDEKDVSDDDESLFTNIPLEQTINYIIEQIYVHKKLMPIRRQYFVSLIKTLSSKH